MRHSASELQGFISAVKLKDIKDNVVSSSSNLIQHPSDLKNTIKLEKMGDLDTSLIKEFAARPAFYDKTSSHYKDKEFIEMSWTEIGNKLGYNASLLRDRMYQLRNRYNLEKRKLDALRAEGARDARSTWPLFFNLNFLDGHIRPRKSYKGMMRRIHRQNTCDDDGGIDDTMSPLMPHVEIKYEGDGGGNSASSSNREIETEDDGQNGMDNNFLNPSSFLVDDADSEHVVDRSTSLQQHVVHQQQRAMRGVNVRNLNSLKRGSNDGLDQTGGSSRKMGRYDNNSNYGFDDGQMHQRPHIDKFEAFGNFMTAALTEMGDEKGLDLIEKFTVEIVQALRDSRLTN